MVAQVAEMCQFLLPPGTSSTAVHELVTREGWRLVTHQPRGREVLARHEWDTGDGRVDLTEDHKSGLRLVGVYSSRTHIERLATQLSLLDESAVLDLARTTGQPLIRMRLLRALSLMQFAAVRKAHANAPTDPAEPEYLIVADDSRYLDLFAVGLTDTEPAIRRASIDALGHSPYPGARTILDGHRDGLPDHIELIDFYLGQPPLRFAAAAAAKS